MPIVLVVDDSELDRRLMGGLLGKDIDWLVEYAENGEDALRRIRDTMPDLVVTDLRMPEMDGIELVEAVRHTFPELPVILATAHGSESLAVEALRRGAASYVSKDELASTLPDVAQQVLEMASHERRLSRLDECVISQRYTYRFENDPQLIPPLVDRVRRKLRDMHLCNITQRMHVGIALEEALLNALYHGNLELPPEEWRKHRGELRLGQFTEMAKARVVQEPYAERTILVGVEISRRRLRFVIRDEGRGFDTNQVPEPRDPSTIQEHGGRGLVLMRNFIDEVTFNDIGNEVTLVAQPVADNLESSSTARASAQS